MIGHEPDRRHARDPDPGDDQRQRQRQLHGTQPLAARVAHAVGGLLDVHRDRVEARHDVPDEDQDRVQDERDDRGQDRQPGDRHHGGEQGDAGDRVQDPRDDRDRGVDAPPAHRPQGQGERDREADGERRQREPEVLERAADELVEVVAHPGPVDHASRAASLRPAPAPSRAVSRVKPAICSTVTTPR